MAWHAMTIQYNTNKYLLKFKRCYNNKYFIFFNYFMYCDDFMGLKQKHKMK